MLVGVTGASGFIGSQIVQVLLEQAYKVRILVRSTSKTTALPLDKIEVVYGDLQDHEALEAFTENLDYLIHCAAITADPDEALVFKTNFEGSVNLLEAVKKKSLQLKRFVFMSSQEAVGINPPEMEYISDAGNEEPLTPYGKSKLAFDRYLAAQNSIPYTIIRPSPVYGPREKDFYILFKMVAQRICPVFFMNNEVSLIHVDDLVAGIIAAMKAPQASNKTYFLTYPERQSWIKGLGTLEKQITGFRIKIPIFRFMLYFTVRIINAASILFGFRTILNMNKYKFLTARNLKIDPVRAQEDFGFDPKIPFSQGARETMLWYKEHKWI